LHGVYVRGGSVDRSESTVVMTERMATTPRVTRAGVAAGLIQKPK